MKKFLMAVAVLALVGNVAYAGPNAGGTLVVHNPNIVYSAGTGYCGVEPLGDCLDAVTRIDMDNMLDTSMVWQLYAAFPVSPVLKAITFGVTYDGTQLFIPEGAWGPCGDFELADGDWPAPGTGTGMTWTEAQHGNPVQVYWFAGYTYYYYSTQFCAAPHPTQGGQFADDSVPAITDDVAGYGCLGVNMDGTLVCPEPPPEPGACCIMGECTITPPDACEGDFYGGPCEPNPCPPPEDGACCLDTGECIITPPTQCPGDFFGGACEPNPCPTPTQQSTWGQIKANYR
jgi:hypothetical protein